MKLVPLNGERTNNEYKHFYEQTGAGSIPIFAGQKNQVGYGIGSIFGNILKAALPVIKQGAKSLGKTALKTGLNIAKDSLQGEKFKDAVKSNLKKAGKEVVYNSLDSIDKKLSGNKKRKH